MRISEIWKQCWHKKNFVAGACMVGLMLLVMAVGFFWMPYDPEAMELDNKLSFFSSAHLLGTDQFGRDILSRMMEGARYSFLIGAAAVATGLLLGGVIGTVAGYYGGKLDELVMKLIDVQMAFPGVLLALMLIVVFGVGLGNMALNRGHTRNMRIVLYVSVIALVVLVLTQGYGKKGIGIVTGILGSLYNGITGYFSDIMSYSRLMALMLAGAVVAQVFNKLGAITGNILTFFIIAMIGNALNFALNILGCFVHDMRLQCLEFFGRFYEDGGKPFRPLNINTKYVDIQK